MEFNSLEYLVFLPLAVAVYYLVPQAVRWVVLLVLSGAFLFLAHPAFPFILLGVAAISFIGGKAIHKGKTEHSKVILLWIFSSVLLSTLTFFKLYHWLAMVFLSLPSQSLFTGSGWILPLGLSYYLFQAIGYLIEVKRGGQNPEAHFGYFTVYLAFFPKLLAGPIERPQHFLPQLKAHHSPGWGHFRMGFRLIIWGLFKKMVVGDRLYLIVEPIFNHPDQFGGIAIAMAMLLFPIQLYADFSGYTDIAIGSARLMGFNLSANFNRPFASWSVSEFWRRWHISLSSWVNDYVFTPLSLAFSMRYNLGRLGLFLALVFSFLLLGAWHGPYKTFLVFGVLQGVAVLLETTTKTQRFRLFNALPEAVGPMLGILFTFLFFSVACVYFVAPSMAFAATTFAQLFEPTQWSEAYVEKHFRFSEIHVSLTLTALFLVADHLVFKKGFEHWVHGLKLATRWAVYGILLFCILALSGVKASFFIYQAF